MFEVVLRGAAQTMSRSICETVAGRRHLLPQINCLLVLIIDYQYKDLIKPLFDIKIQVLSRLPSHGRQARETLIRRPHGERVSKLIIC